VFFTQHQTDFFSLRDIQHLVRKDKLSLFDFVFDTDGGSYSIDSILRGKAPRWAMSAEHDPMLCDMPPLTESQLAMVNEAICEPDFLEMPTEPTVKTVEDYLANEPRIARLVADTERWMSLTGGI
jgi:hypothetical protein